jgi:hypothetical protein
MGTCKIQLRQIIPEATCITGGKKFQHDVTLNPSGTVKQGASWISPNRTLLPRRRLMHVASFSVVAVLVSGKLQSADQTRSKEYSPKSPARSMILTLRLAMRSPSLAFFVSAGHICGSGLARAKSAGCRRRSPPLAGIIQSSPGDVKGAFRLLSPSGASATRAILARMLGLLQGPLRTQGAAGLLQG